MSWLVDLIEARLGDARDLHDRHVNPRAAAAARMLGFDRDFRRAEGAWLVDAAGERYLDLVAGHGVFFLGRGHPDVVAAVRDAASLELPSLVQPGVAPLAGLLAEALLRVAPAGLERAVFAGSGSEAVEAAIKLARDATGRARILHADGAFHGLTNGALALCGSEFYRAGFGPFLPGAAPVALNDTLALEAALASRDVAALFLEPIQGHGVREPHQEFLTAAADLCRRYGTLLVVDEVMTGLGRTGAMFAIERSHVAPDMLLVSKTLSGGLVPVSAVLTTAAVHERVLRSTDRAGILFTTFGQNNLAMAAGLATLHVIERDGLVERAARLGAHLTERVLAMKARHPVLRGVRGRGLMLGIELGPPDGGWQRLDWEVTHRLNASLFCLKIAMDLMARHRILTLSAGRGLDVLRLLPPAVVEAGDLDHFCDALDEVLTRNAELPGVLVDLGVALSRRALG